MDYAGRRGARWNGPERAPASVGLAPGKRTLTETLPSASAPVQRKAAAGAPAPVMPSGPRPTIHDLFGRVQCKAACAESDIEQIQALFGRGAPAPSRVGATDATGPSAGAPLPVHVQEAMGRAFATDFSTVRVHQGGAADALGARAFASGEQIHFARGQYDPTSTLGRELIGHELAHVVQQREGRVSERSQAAGGMVNEDPTLEREADEQGARVARGEIAGTRPSRTLAPSSRGPVQGKFSVGKGPNKKELTEEEVAAIAELIEDEGKRDDFLHKAKLDAVYALEELVGEAEAHDLLRRGRADLAAVPGEKRKVHPGIAAHHAERKRAHTSKGKGTATQTAGEDETANKVAVAKIRAGLDIKARAAFDHYCGDIVDHRSDSVDRARVLADIVKHADEKTDTDRLVTKFFHYRQQRLDSRQQFNQRDARNLIRIIKKITDDDELDSEVNKSFGMVTGGRQRDFIGEARQAAQQSRRTKKLERRKQDHDAAERARGEALARTEQAGPLVDRDSESHFALEAAWPELRNTPADYDAQLQKWQPLLLATSNAAVQRVIRQHDPPLLVTSEGEDLYTDEGAGTLRGERRPGSSAGLYFLDTGPNWKESGHHLLEHLGEDSKVTIGNMQNSSVRGEKVPQLGTYPEVQWGVPELGSEQLAEVIRIGRLERVKQRLRELLAAASDREDQDSEEEEATGLEVAAEPSAALLRDVRARHWLYLHENGRYPSGAIANALSVLAAELGLWDLRKDYYGGRLFPMHDQKATTVTGEKKLSDKERKQLAGVEASVVNVMREFVKAYFEADEHRQARIRRHKIAGPFLHKLLTLLEADPDSLVRAKEEFELAATRLLRSPERTTTPEFERPGTPERYDERDRDPDGGGALSGSLTDGLLALPEDPARAEARWSLAPGTHVPKLLSQRPRVRREGVGPARNPDRSGVPTQTQRGAVTSIGGPGMRGFVRAAIYAAGANPDSLEADAVAKLSAAEPRDRHDGSILGIARAFGVALIDFMVDRGVLNQPRMLVIYTGSEEHVACEFGVPGTAIYVYFSDSDEVFYALVRGPGEISHSAGDDAPALHLELERGGGPG